MPVSITSFPQELVSDLVSKVSGKSSLAKLSAQKPIPFTGSTEFTFSMDNEIDIVAENGTKSHGGITVTPVTIVPIKFEYGARVSQEFMTASEENQIRVLEAFNDGFAKKVARGLDLAAMHGVNPRTTSASAVVGNNHFDYACTGNDVTYVAANADSNLEAAIAAIQADDGTINGMALSPAFAAAMGAIVANGVKQYPEYAFGGNPELFRGIRSDVNNTVSSMVISGHDYALVGDFENGFKWGYAKEIPLRVIEYGDPDNTGADLQGHNQVYLRAEIYMGWGILLPDSFARICTTG